MSGTAPGRPQGRGLELTVLPVQVELRNGRGWPIGAAHVCAAGPDVTISCDGDRHTARVDRGALRRWLRRPDEPLVDGDVRMTGVSGAVVLQIGRGAGLVQYVMPGSAVDRFRTAL